MSGNAATTNPQPSPPAMEWTGEMVDRFWRWQAAHPDHYFANRFGHRIAAALAPLLGECGSVVDYGCGPGFLVPHLIRHGFEVSATDQSPEALSAVEKRCVGIAGFGGALPADALIADGTQFDAAIAIEVIEHLDDARLEVFFGNLRKLLRPGGVAVITTPNDERLEDAAVYCPNCDHIFHRYQHLRSWSAQSLAARIAAEGLTVENTYATDFSEPRFGNLTGKAKRIVKHILGRPEKRPHLVSVARLPG